MIPLNMRINSRMQKNGRGTCHVKKPYKKLDPTGCIFWLILKCLGSQCL